MNWTEGVLHISNTFEIHGGYSGIISFGILVIVIVLYFLLVCHTGAMIGDTVKEVNKRHGNRKG